MTVMKPDAYQTITSVIEHIIEHKLESRSLKEVAASFGVSPGHLQKIFTTWVGVSPKQFGRYLSLQYAKEKLATGCSTEDTTLKTKLSSSGRLHDLFVDIEAMTPGEFKDGTLAIYYETFNSPFGICLVASTDKGICNILFADSKQAVTKELRSRWPHANLQNVKGLSLHKPVIDFISGINPKKKIKLHLRGTNFQLKVWEALLSIPEGQLSSYGEVASVACDRKMARAAGSAIGDNPIGYLIPCHRVLKSTGEISGYHWGVPRKRAMLTYEALRTNDN